MGWHFKHFLLLKNGKLEELSAQVTEMWKNVFYVLFWLSNNVSLDKNTIFCWFYFPQIVQKDIGCGGKLNGHFDGQLCQKYSLSKIILIWQYFFKLQSKMSRMFFFRTRCRFTWVWLKPNLVNDVANFVPNASETFALNTISIYVGEGYHVQKYPEPRHRFNVRSFHFSLHHPPVNQYFCEAMGNISHCRLLQYSTANLIWRSSALS